MNNIGFYLTKQQLTWMTNALPASSWEMMLRLEGGDRNDVIPVTYTLAQLFDDSTIRFLRAKNMGGYHIYGRPIPRRSIMVDDVCRDDINAMMTQNMIPSLIVETSPCNYQAWFALSNTEIDEDLAVEAARILTQRYNGDVCSVKRSQFARIPGFTNRKQMYMREENGKELYDFAKVFVHPGHNVTNAARKLLEEAHTALGARRASRSLHSVVHHDYELPLEQGDWHSDMTPEEAVGIHNAVTNKLADRFDWPEAKRRKEKGTRSDVDFAVARHLLWDDWSAHDVIAVILYGSDKGREQGFEYAAHTLMKAIRHDSLHST